MKPRHDSLPLLRRLHERVFADAEVRAVLDAGFAQLAAELERRSELPHATCTIPIEPFEGATGAGAGRDQVRLCRLFLLRSGARMAVPERHRNSVQRLVSYRGKGCIHQGATGSGPEGRSPRTICSPSRKPDAPADLNRHWDVVPEGVWHFPEAANDEDWATVTFHSATEDEIVDETGAHTDQP